MRLTKHMGMNAVQMFDDRVADDEVKRSVRKRKRIREIVPDHREPSLVPDALKQG